MGRSWRGQILEESDCMPWTSEHCTIKCNLRLSDVVLSAVEDDAMVLGSLHQVQEVSVMFLGSVTEDEYIIMNGNNPSRQMVCCLVNLHL